MRAVKKVIAGWGNYPKESCYLFRPEKNKELLEALQSHEQAHYISRGLGRSYGDTALNEEGGVLLHTRLNRMTSFDPETGILECEAGVSFEEILAHFLPHGYFLPVTPGTKYVTVGGAIANDVHGKNHHRDGSLSAHILAFTLLVASGETLTCSREQNTDLFWATIGGIGLTGIIMRVRMRLMKVESAYISVDYKKAANLTEALRLLSETDDQYQYSVAWIDCLATGKSLGRSVLMLGNHMAKDEFPGRKGNPLAIKEKRKLNMPMNLPSFTLNPFTIRTFNFAYYHRFKDASEYIVDYDSFFYPLDSILNWNRMYGRNGFIQYQMVFPPQTSEKGLTKILDRLSRTGRSSFLAVLKSFGDRGQGLLSFPRKGYTLALDIPMKGPEMVEFIHELDEIVLSYGGKIYLAKDSLMTSETFHEMYPEVIRFRKIKAEIDPNGIFSSSMARRLKIMEGWR
jgi:decaprenylphospho-beta-D-ribofuranose 2-oxidase